VKFATPIQDNEHDYIVAERQRSGAIVNVSYTYANNSDAAAQKFPYTPEEGSTVLVIDISTIREYKPTNKWVRR
jgi:hypothetical protein